MKKKKEKNVNKYDQERERGLLPTLQEQKSYKGILSKTVFQLHILDDMGTNSKEDTNNKI